MPQNDILFYSSVVGLLYGWTIISLFLIEVSFKCSFFLYNFTKTYIILKWAYYMSVTVYVPDISKEIHLGGCSVK